MRWARFLSHKTPLAARLYYAIVGRKMAIGQAWLRPHANDGIFSFLRKLGY